MYRFLSLLSLFKVDSPPPSLATHMYKNNISNSNRTSTRMISGNRTSGGTRRNEGSARVEPSGATSAIATNQPSTSTITI